NGTQRWYCRQCFLTYSESAPQVQRIFTDRQLALDKAATAIRCLMEGTSVRGACRLLRIGKHTLLELVLKLGRECKRFMERVISEVPCYSVQCDELWSFVYCKERTREREQFNEDACGDCYTWTAIERNTKLLLAYAVGKRDNATAMRFARNLRR